MASNNSNDAPRQLPPTTQAPGPNEKVLHVWSKPIEGAEQHSADGAQPISNEPPKIKDAIGMIKKDDFANIAQLPCARQGLMAGIATGAGAGGITFIIRGSIPKATNWAVGMFLAASTASYEYCQYQRRAERIQMKRNVEVVSEERRQQNRKIMEARQQHKQLEEKRLAAERPWYRFW